MPKLRAWLPLLAWILVCACGEPDPSTLSSGLTRLTLQLETPPEPLLDCGDDGGPLSSRGEKGASGALLLATWNDEPVAIIADADEHALHVVNVDTMARLSTTELPEAPGHIALIEGGRLAVTLRHANRVMLLRAGTTAASGFALGCTAAVTREPIALASHGDALWVLAGYGGELVELDVKTLEVRRRLPLAREPRGLMIDPVRGMAWVSHMVGGQLSRVSLASGEVVDVPLHRKPRAGGSRAIQGFALAATTGPEGFDRVFNPLVSSVEPDPERDRRFRYYSETLRIFEPWVGTVDAAAGAMLAAGEAPNGRWRAQCVLPRAAVVAQGRLWVACLDEGTVLELEPRFVDPMVGLYRQLRVAEGPTALVAADDQLFVWSLHGHALTRLTMPPSGGPTAKGGVPAEELVLPRRENTTWTEAKQLGRKLFTTRRDHRVSGNGSACAGCHPEGRDDGLTWGTGTTTMFLAGRLANSAPFGWHGEAATLEERIQKTTIRLLGKGFRQAERDELEALADYVRALRPPPPPRPQAVASRLAIERGRKLFEEDLTCNNCHPGGGTNGSRLPIGDGLFDTPPLAFVGGSPPFFHDRRYPTLDAVLQDENEPMAPTSGLPASQRRDLIAYLEALPFGVVDEDVPIVAAVALAHDGWLKDAPSFAHKDVRVAPGRYLAAPPVAIDVDTIASVDLPEKALVRKGTPFIWARLRDRGGRLKGIGSGTVLSFSDEEVERGSVVPLIVASARGGDTIEVGTCHIHPNRYGHDWHGNTLHSMLCSEPEERTLATGLGSFGIAVRTEVEGLPGLLVMGPDASPDVSGEALNIGALERTFSDSYFVALAPGKHAEVVRLGGHDSFWIDSAFALKPTPAVLSASWSEGASKPRLLVAEITRAKLGG